MNFKNLKKHKRDGFTLVEMVIVVAILGILSGIGFMQFGKVQENSKKNADYTVAANLATAASLYMTDYPEEITYKDKDIFDISLKVLKEKGYINSIPKSFVMALISLTLCSLDDAKTIFILNSFFLS